MRITPWAKRRPRVRCAPGCNRRTRTAGSGDGKRRKTLWTAASRRAASGAVRTVARAGSSHWEEPCERLTGPGELIIRRRTCTGRRPTLARATCPAAKNSANGMAHGRRGFPASGLAALGTGGTHPTPDLHEAQTDARAVFLPGSCAIPHARRLLRASDSQGDEDRPPGSRFPQGADRCGLCLPTRQ